MPLGPQKITPLNFLLKVLGGLTGGVIGSLVLLAIFLLNSSIIEPVLQNTSQQIHPLFILIFMGMIFLACLLANLTAAAGTVLANNQKETRLSTVVYQVFFANLIFFLIITPIYLIVWRLNINWLILVAGLHVIISTQASNLLSHMINSPTYAVLGVYSSMVAILVGLGINIFLYQLAGNNLSVLLFSSLPVFWFCLSFFESLSEVIYYGLYGLYGVDFLNIFLNYGNDDSMSGEDDKEMSEEDKEKALLSIKKDEEGEEFLKKKDDKTNI